MTISAFDVDSYNKPGFDFGIAYAEGYRAGYIKLGGDNLSPRYCGSGYQNQFNAFAAQPFEHRGCYWVTGGYDPVGSANFYLAHRDPRTTFDVLDNETLDDGTVWSDSEACAFFDVLIAAGLTDLWQYGSRDSLWNTHSWPGLEARGIKAIVAIYNDAPFTNINPRTYSAELVKGHQFTSSASIGGLGAIDENAFTDDAFTGTPAPKEEDDMSFSLIKDAQSATVYVCSLETGNRKGIAGPSHLTLLQRFKAGDPGMLIVEMDICRSYLQVINPPTSVDQASVSATIIAALKDAKVSVDPATVAAAVQQGVQDQTAALTKAINDDAAARLKS
jgi:hypothetical protein